MNDIRHLVVAALVGATLSTGVCAGVIGGALTERAARTDPAGTGAVPAAVSAPARPGTPRADVVLPVAGRTTPTTAAPQPTSTRRSPGTR